MIVDADNIMRFPFDPVQLHVEPGDRCSTCLQMPANPLCWAPLH